MDKELILKYKAEFDYWLNEGNVQAYYKKDDEPSWFTDKECMDCDNNDNFSHILQKSLGPDDVLIIIDDEYVEFRKALAEGKTVEFKHPQVGYEDWEIVTQEHLFQSVVLGREYRIKPEEPKFKAGDWVVHPDAATPWKLTQNSINHLDNSELKLWQPKKGEWCWVGYKLMKFNKLIKEDYNTTFEFILPDRDADGYKIKEHILERHLQVVEPFIGQLPSYLKE